MKAPINIRTKQPLNRAERKVRDSDRQLSKLMTEQDVVELRSEMGESRLDELFADISQRIRGDLARIDSATVALALGPTSREQAVLLIRESRSWIEEFERALGSGDTASAV